jgi:hypothetical protein
MYNIDMPDPYMSLTMAYMGLHKIAMHDRQDIIQNKIIKYVP